MIQDADTGPRARQVAVVVDETPAPEYVAEALDVEVGEPVLYRSRQFLVEDRPVQLSTSFLPLDIAGAGSRTPTWGRAAPTPGSPSLGMHRCGSPNG